MSQATEMLALYVAAEQAVLEGKEARLADRMLRLEDLAEIREGRQEWERRVAGEQASAAGVSSLGFSLARFDQ